jgi:hypothetical protein
VLYYHLEDPTRKDIDMGQKIDGMETLVRHAVGRASKAFDVDERKLGDYVSRMRSSASRYCVSLKDARAPVLNGAGLKGTERVAFAVAMGFVIRRMEAFEPKSKKVA